MCDNSWVILLLLVADQLSAQSRANGLNVIKLRAPDNDGMKFPLLKDNYLQGFLFHRFAYF